MPIFSPGRIRLASLIAFLPLFMAGPSRADFVNVATGALADTKNSFGVAWGDYNQDGWVDLFICNTNGPNRLFRNEAGASFTSMPIPAATSSTYSAVWGDVDGDGDLDLYLANSDANQLFRNDSGTLVNATIGFEELGQRLSIPSKSLHRMLSARGNPGSDSFLRILAALLQETGTRLQVAPRRSRATRQRG